MPHHSNPALTALAVYTAYTGNFSDAPYREDKAVKFILDLATELRNAKNPPVATLHDDGYYTFKPGQEPKYSNLAGWSLDVYAHPDENWPNQNRWAKAVDKAMVDLGLDCTTAQSDPEACLKLLIKHAMGMGRDFSTCK